MFVAHGWNDRWQSLNSSWWIGNWCSLSHQPFWVWIHIGKFFHFCLLKKEYYSTIKKQQYWVICRDVDGPGVCHIEWSKSGEKQISYINTYMRNLEKRYRWTYFQGRNRDRGIENRCVDTVGGRMRWEIGNDLHTTMCEIDSQWEPAVQHRECSVMT